MAGSQNTSRKGQSSGTGSRKSSAGRKPVPADKKVTRRNTARKSAELEQDEMEQTESIWYRYQEEIILMLVLVLSVLLLLSNFHLCGPAGEFINQAAFGLMGFLAYIFPVLLFFGTAFYLSNRKNRSIVQKLICMVLLYFILAALLQMVTYGSSAELKIKDLYFMSANGRDGGGFLGGGLAKLLCSVIDVVGTYIVLIGAILVLLMFITEKFLFAFVGNKYQERRRLRQERKEREVWLEESALAIEEVPEELEDLSGKEHGMAYERNVYSLEEQKRKRRKVSSYTFPAEEEKNTDSVEMRELKLQNLVIQRGGETEVVGVSPYYEEEIKKKFGVQTEKQPHSEQESEEMQPPQRQPEKPENLPKAAKPNTPKEAGSSLLQSLKRKKERPEPIESHTVSVLPVSSTKEKDVKPPIEEGLLSWDMLDKNLDILEAAPAPSGKEELEPISAFAEHTPVFAESTLQKPAEHPQPESGSEPEPVLSEPVSAKLDLSDALLTESVPSKSVSREVAPLEIIPPESGLSEVVPPEVVPSEAISLEAAPPEVISLEAISSEAILPEVASPNVVPTAQRPSEQLPLEAMLPEAAAADPVSSGVIAGEAALPKEEPVLSEVSSSERALEEEKERILKAKSIEGNQPLDSYAKTPPVENHSSIQNEPVQKAEPASTLSIPAIQPSPEPYRFPSVKLLNEPPNDQRGASNEELQETAMTLQKTLDSFGVRVTVTNVSCGPAVTRYELQPERGVKVSRITGLTDDIKLNLAAADIRIEAPIPGKAAVGIEVPNKENATVFLRELLETDAFKEHKSSVAFAVGKDIGGQTVVTDIAKMPHLLIAGATGSGKSVCINTLIMSVLYKADPNDVKLIMIDPKVVELSVYNGIPHLLIPVVTDPKKASGALNWAVMEMMDRYQRFADVVVRDVKGYNEKIASAAQYKEDPRYVKMPQIVIIVDELADLMMVAPGEVEDAICRLAQLARAAGIHLVIATQRPSVNVITGLIKANIPSRIAFAVSSAIDSRTILDGAGAEKLLGKGDMLFFPTGYPKPVRVQGAFVTDQEVTAVVDYLREQHNGASYNAEIIKRVDNAQPSPGNTGGDAAYGNGNGQDEYFAEAGKFIIEKDKASIGMLQRVYKIGFNRAARIMDQLSEAGVVGPEEGTKPRKVLMSLEEFENYLEQN